MKTLLCLLVLATSVFAGESEELKRNRKIYLQRLQKIESERDAKVKKLTEQYLKVLKKVQVAHTKEGNLEEALQVRKAILQLEGVVKTPEEAPAPEEDAPKEKTGPRSKIVIHQTTNGRALNVGVSRGTVKFMHRGRKVSEKKFELAWIPNKNTSVALKLPKSVDQIHITCVRAGKQFVGLAEVEIFNAAGKNIAPETVWTAESEDRVHPVACLVDGRKEASDARGNWATKGPIEESWVEFDWSKK